MISSVSGIQGVLMHTDEHRIPLKYNTVGGPIKRSLIKRHIPKILKMVLINP